MSSVTEVRTFADIYTEILNKMRQPTNVTAITNQAKRYANTALHDMVFGFEYKLPWLERQANIITAAPYSTGTVSITRGSTSLVGDSTLWSTVNAYGVANARTTGKLNLGGPDVYGITTVGGAGTITLATRYVASADLDAGASYTYFEDEYTLASDFLKPIDYRRFSVAINIPIIGRNEFQRKFPRPNISGMPKVATLLDKPFNGSASPVMLVQFYPYPNANMIIPYSYITRNLAVSTLGVEATSMAEDTDEPALPVRYRNALVSYAIWKWYRDKKDDARSESAKADYQDEVNRIVGDQRIGANTNAQTTPRPGMYNTRSIYRGGAGKKYSVNNSFDDFRS
jgi:hypothetical protein